MKTYETDAKSYIYDMRTNDCIDPLGIECSCVIFSWKVWSDALGWLQSAYRIQVNRDNITVWDSGRVETGESVGIVCEGSLEPCRAYTWTVTVWDNSALPLTCTAHFETGLPEEDSFGKATWISCRQPNGNSEEAGKDQGEGKDIVETPPVFRKAIVIEKVPITARLYTSGLGVYETFINGERVGRLLEDQNTVYDVLKPGFTESSVRKFYSTYDVTHLLTLGENVLSAVVTPGWWSDAVAGHFGKACAYLAKLVLIYEDGSCQVVDTDTSWKSARASAVVYADIFSGETYDARKDESWKRKGFDDSLWEAVVINTEFKGVICPWKGSPIRMRRDLSRSVQTVTIYRGSVGVDDTKYGKIALCRVCGDEVFTLLPGETAVVDFGQNFAGCEAFWVEGPRGATVSVTHGEMLNDGDGLISRGNDGPEGSVYNENYRLAKAKTRYILKGEGMEAYHPTFTFYGFRYLEVTADRAVTFHGIRGLVITSVEKETGFLETSDTDVNRLIENIRWGQYSNYLSVPTDCPQRDERQGWTADTQVFSKAGCYLAFSKSFLTKFTCDMRDSQRQDGAYPGIAPRGEYNGAGWGGTGWADGGIILPYVLYRFYGDKSVIRQNWDAMQRYVDGFLAASDNYGPCAIWGDWLAYESNDKEIQTMLGIAFYAWDALMMAEMAEAIGFEEEVPKYRALYEQEKAFFQSLYVKEDGTLKRGEQSVCCYALYLDLLPNEASVEVVKEQLTGNIIQNGNRLQTGFLGTAILLPVLTKIGRSDLAYSLLLQHENPSWLYSVDQGATTVWERWNSYTRRDGFGDVGMNSFNHYAYGVVAAWMFETMAGIGAMEPGFKRIVLAPQPDRRLTGKASYDSAYGRITAEWAYEDGKWCYRCSIPANTTARICMPLGSFDACSVNGKSFRALSLKEDGIVFVGRENDVCVYEAVSGSFTFLSENK